MCEETPSRRPALGPLSMSSQQRQEIEQWLRAPIIPYDVFVRALIILAAADGSSDSVIARNLKVNRKTVRVWRTRFIQQGLAALWVIAPGRGRKRKYSPQQVASVVETARPTQPQGRTPWTCRELAARLGVSKSTVSRILSAHNISVRNNHNGIPVKLDVFEDLSAVVGLYVNTPEKAILFRIPPGTPWPALTNERHERSTRQQQIRRLDRLLCSVTGRRYKSRREQEFFRFLRRVDREFIGDFPLHMIVEQAGTPNDSRFQKWLTRNLRFSAHFVPPGCAWLEIVRYCLGEICVYDVCDGAEALNTAISEFLEGGSSEPFVWTVGAKSLFSGSDRQL